MALQPVSTLELDQQRILAADGRDGDVYRHPGDGSYAALARTSTVTEASLKSLDTFGFILGTIITLGPLAATALLAH